MLEGRNYTYSLLHPAEISGDSHNSEHTVTRWMDYFSAFQSISSWKSTNTISTLGIRLNIEFFVNCQIW